MFDSSPEIRYKMASLHCFLNMQNLMHKFRRIFNSIHIQKFCNHDTDITVLLTGVLPDGYSREYCASIFHKKNTIRNIFSNNKCTTEQTTCAIITLYFQAHCVVKLLLLLQPLYDPLSGTTQVSWYQKDNHSGFC